jgi:hypothetical protein
MKRLLNFSDLPSVIHAIALAVAVLLVAVLSPSIDDPPPPLGPYTAQEILEFKASIGGTNVEAASSIAPQSVGR